MSAGGPRVDRKDARATEPLWRAAQVFRLATLVYAVSYQVASVANYTRPTLSWAVVALMAVWTGLAALGLSRNAAARPYLVAIDQVVVVALMASTRLVSDQDWYSTHQTLPTTLWATNAVISAAILGGPLLGVASGATISVVSAVVRGQVDLDLWRDATAPVLISVGLALGLAANTARRSHAQLERAAHLTAAAEERERLGREVHDGVLQVLAYVRRRGTEIGGPTLELATLAGEQEVALRELISEQATPVHGGGDVDLRPLLRAEASTTVSVSAPAVPVPMARERAGEVAAVVRTALSNVALHAGAAAKAYVLLEDIGDEVIVSVRDDGAGLAPGRLSEAEAEGRMGVSRSILGRVADLGGTATLESAPGEGVEWEIRVRKQAPGKG
ncbi:MacS family sensor histidine kinase [Rhodococcus sp. NPDC058514]|uniref:MacS family sensor histidine kinase n=1 Tax=unclassified Rhodococcus (in: high G+C Gram-positive bacteria) TaxID=192944 RepID=UPI0036655218